MSRVAGVSTTGIQYHNGFPKLHVEACDAGCHVPVMAITVVVVMVQHHHEATAEHRHVERPP